MENNIKNKVKEYIYRHEMINKGDRICVAVSGGADSMCLLFLMLEMEDELGIELSAVHVEHGIRGQASVDDMVYVENQCKELGISLATARIDAVSMAESTGMSLEEAARHERYRIFDDVAADKIALAHHLNDQVETVLFNAARGTGVRGLRGMEPIRGRYIRPLLCISRQEIEEYCRAKNIDYRHDATNDDLDIARNRIRQVIVPELKKINEASVYHIYEAAEDIAEIEEYLEGQTRLTFSECLVDGAANASVRQGNSVTLDIDRLDGLHSMMASRVIKEALVKVSGRAKDITRRHIDAVIALTKGQSGRHIDLIYGMKATKEFRRLRIWKAQGYEPRDGAIQSNPQGKKNQPQTSPYPETHSMAPINKPILHTAILDKANIPMEDIIKDDAYTKFVDYATIEDVSSLTVRHRQAGDFISIKGGNKKLKDLLIEEKVPRGERDGQFFIATGSEIVWMPETGRIGERFKVTDSTKKILRMEIENG